MNSTEKMPTLTTVPRTLVLVGLMGAGKTCIGRELAQRLDLPFVDADVEIEEAAGCSIDDIFKLYGETEFRAGERRVIARLLNDPVHVLATGGGAFLDEDTRENVGENGVSIWLRADLDLLVSRVSRRNNRPLLKGGNQREILERLMEERYPLYEKADIVVDSGREAPEITADRVIKELQNYITSEDAEANQP
jgi:shikimate kinase